MPVKREEDFGLVIQTVRILHMDSLFPAYDYLMNTYCNSYLGKLIVKIISI
jgi:hypothetical protein